MNYRHLYHAGNFADVFKHCILIMLINALCKKDKPFCYLDTHAGTGHYDLTSELAQKTREHENGIVTIYNQFSELPAIKTYQQLVAAINSAPSKTALLQFYPGSPAIAQALLRPQDSMILSELHPEDAATLKQYFAKDHRIAVHHADGYQSLKAFLPPKKNKGRGLIFIDPPFEQTNEWQQIIAALNTALQRYPTGIYAVWLPIKGKIQIKEFYQELQQLNCKNILVTGINVSEKLASEVAGLTSCGMAIINAPWDLERELVPTVTWLSSILSLDSPGSYHINWLIKN